jgi:hypothetical protein
LESFLFDLVPFNNDVMKGDLAELRAKGEIKIEVDKIKLENSWCAQLVSFLQLSKTALEVFVPFSRAHMCEMVLLPLVLIKTKVTNGLNGSDDMSVAILKLCSLLKHHSKTAKAEKPTSL